MNSTKSMPTHEDSKQLLIENPINKKKKLQNWIDHLRASVLLLVSVCLSLSFSPSIRSSAYREHISHPATTLSIETVPLEWIAGTEWLRRPAKHQPWDEFAVKLWAPADRIFVCLASCRSASLSIGLSLCIYPFSVCLLSLTGCLSYSTRVTSRKIKDNNCIRICVESNSITHVSLAPNKKD